MNFGPQWLRNMASDAAPKYQLAEYRYSREDMLGLFDRTYKPPDHLARMGELFIEKTQTPLSLLPMTEDETKLWSRNELVRVGGKAPPGLPGASLRGRGGSVDRGRGRGRGTYYTYSSRPGFEEADAKDTNPPFLRTSRSFDRSQMGERGWPERNGGDPTEWNGSTSPRKEYGPMAGSLSRGGHSQNDSNWRRSRTDEPDDGWRQREQQQQREQKWPRSSWREEGEGGGPGAQDGQKVPPGARTNWGRGWADDGVRLPPRDPDYDRRQDDIPEWAQDNIEPSGGSFDATGAFHGSYDDEEAIYGDSKKDPGSKEQRSSPTSAEPPVSERRASPPSAPPEKTASQSAMSDAHSLDRIRARHQNFVTKAEPDGVPPQTAMGNSAPQAKEPKPDMSQPPPNPGAMRENPVATRQSSEEDMSRLAVDSVVKLIEEEDRERLHFRPPTEHDVWYYKDPNEREQGPFRSSEMLSWFRSGYFQDSLLLRRDFEDRFTTLGQLKAANRGHVPFFNSVPPPSPAVFPTDQFSFLGPRDTVKMPDVERWQTMSQAEQNVFIQQKLALSQQSMLDPNAMARLLSQLQQSNISPQQQPTVDPSMAESVRALMMMGHAPAAHHLPHPGMNLNSVLPGMPAVPPTDMQKEDALQRVLLRKQLEASKVSQQRPVIDSLWSGPGRPMWANGLAGGPGGVPVQAVGMPRWEMKTEDEILAEQQKHAQRMAEELRKKEEEEKMRREEEDRREQERREDDRRRMEEESLRLQKEREREEEEAQRRLEEQRRKMEEMIRLEEAQRKKEERDRRKEEEKARKRRDEEEKKRQEDELRRVEAEAEEARRQADMVVQQQEQQKRQEEALRILKEQQMKTRVKPWSQSQIPQPSLADIQAQERERKLREQRERESMMNLMAAEQMREAEEKSKSSSMILKWATGASPRNVNVKSLAEIQAEEASKLQLEKERQERTQVQREIPVTAGIWGAGSLAWGGQNSAPWGGVAQQSPPTSGFWEDASAKAKSKAPSSPTKAKAQNTNGTKKPSVGNNVKPAKPKNKRDEAAVMKLFEPQGDEFTTWCSQALHALNANIDVPTFTTFLCDLESPFEVKDYVKMYIGESRDSAEFARSFLERRSRWKEARRANNYDDELCAPAAAINPTQSGDAQDAARKAGKKTKKGKMIKVDTRILGFSVTAAENRTNVGERETWDPAS